MRNIISLIEQRKRNLQGLLEERPEELALERQHQLYGAINELEFVHKALSKHWSVKLKKD